MSIQVKLMLWLLSLAVVAGCLFASYRYGRHVESLEQVVQLDAAIKKQQDDNIASLQLYAKTISDAGVQHDKDQSIVNRLSRDFSRVHVHIPTCPVYTEASAASGVGGASGVLPDSVDFHFARLQDRVSALVERCDQLNIDSIRLNASLK